VKFLTSGGLEEWINRNALRPCVDKEWMQSRDEAKR
jgi:hypothetical protein